MATATANGKKFNFPEGTTPEQMGVAIDEFFQNQGGDVPATPDEPSRLDSVVGGLETAATLATGVAAEPIAGITGLLSLPFKGSEAGEIVGKVREALTFTPKTEEGSAMLQGLGDVLSPVISALEKAEQTAGDAGFELAGPVGGAAGATLPTAALSLVGAGSGRGALSAAKNTKNAADVNKILKDAAPTTERLKAEARTIYKEIDGLDVAIDADKFGGLAEKIVNKTLKEGFHPKIHPKVDGVLDEVVNQADTAKSLSDIDTLRKVARGAAKSTDADEVRLGSMIVDQIDGFLDDLPGGSLTNSRGLDVGPMFKNARKLWGKAKRAELIEDAVEKAKNQASGFENGLRTQFRSILNNKKKLRGFTADEKAAMQKIVRGGKAENIARALGKFGFTEGQASSMLLSSLGVAGGGAAFGSAGAIAVPVIGQGMRNIAQSLTRNNVKLASEIVRAGPDSRKIANAYILNTPKKSRSVEALTGLLLESGSDISAISKSSNKLLADAAYFASIINAAKVPADESQNQPLDNQN